MTTPLQPSWEASPSGDDCLILQFATVLTAEANRRAAQAAALIDAARERGELGGVIDVVPGMVTVGIHYHPERLAIGDEPPYAVLEAQLRHLLADLGDAPVAEGRRIEIPVCYGGEHGPDLAETAERCGLSPAGLVDYHTSRWFDVLMIGFAPGHPHIGIFDEHISPPRRSTPRTLVRRGSIGLANRQSVIYPMDCPGGWSLIGRTPLRMFDTAQHPPGLLRIGDQVRFKVIDADTFDRLEAEEHA